jgi:hypothetical protein
LAEVTGTSDEVATRVERPVVAAHGAAEATSDARRPAPTLTPEDTLRLDEVGRFRRMTYPSLMVALAIVLGLMPFLPGDPLAVQVFVVGIAIYAAGASWLRWKVRDPDEWRERNLTVIAACGGAVVFGVIYYWGPFSFAPMLIVAAVYVTACDGGVPHAVLTYGLAAATSACRSLPRTTAP